jgi:hypothetical protein
MITKKNNNYGKIKNVIYLIAILTYIVKII